MTQFLEQDSLIPPYMAFPRFLLDKDGLSETAKILYTILLHQSYGYHIAVRLEVLLVHGLKILPCSHLRILF